MGNAHNENNFYESDDENEIGNEIGSGYEISPTDDASVWMVCRRGEFVRYMIKPESDVFYAAEEKQIISNESWKIHEIQNKDFAKPPVILRKCEYTEEIMSGYSEFTSESENSDEYDDTEDQKLSDEGEGIIATFKNLITGKKSGDILPFTNSVGKEKQTDTEEGNDYNPNHNHAYNGMDFGTQSQKEEEFGDIPFVVNDSTNNTIGSSRKLKNRRSQLKNSITTETENSLVKTCGTYFFKRLGRNWDGWYTSDDPNLLNDIKWARNKRLVETNILDEIRKEHQTNLRQGKVFTEEQKVISQLHEKFCHQTLSTHNYHQSTELFISKTFAIMNNIQLEKIQNESLKKDLTELAGFAELYHKHKKDWILSDKN